MDQGHCRHLGSGFGRPGILYPGIMVSPDDLCRIEPPVIHFYQGVPDGKNPGINGGSRVESPGLFDRERLEGFRRYIRKRKSVPDPIKPIFRRKARRVDSFFPNLFCHRFHDHCNHIKEIVKGSPLSRFLPLLRL